MKYRQWKKNYKKRYGVNPPVELDKRKRRRQAARAIKALAYADFSESILRAAEAITSALAGVMRAVGSACDIAGTAFRNTAEAIQPTDIKGRVFSWEVRQYTADMYAVYEINALGGEDMLRALTHRRSAADKIAEILENDQREYLRATNPERITHKDTADALRCGVAAACAEEGRL